MQAEADAKAGIRNSLLPEVEGAGRIFLERVFGGLASIFRGEPAPPGLDDVHGAFRDVQLDITDRLDLLDGVRGYVHAYQSVNVNAEWGLNNTRDMPFTSQKGPSRGGHVVTSGRGGIVLDDPGAWIVGVKCTTNTTAYTGSDEAYVELQVYSPGGTMLSYSRCRAQPGRGSDSLVDTAAIVVPEPGCTVRVMSWTGRWRWWLGGTAWSSLWAIKQSDSAINPGQTTVPNETH